MKKIKFESFKYQLLYAAKNSDFNFSHDQCDWIFFLDNLSFKYAGEYYSVSWQTPCYDEINLPSNEAKFFTTSSKYYRYISDKPSQGNLDLVKKFNEEYFSQVVEIIANRAGFTMVNKRQNYSVEQDFHDNWAEKENLSSIDVVRDNEVCTAPEMRYILDSLGDIRGKKLLDVGCGLGEASVYFATKGAKVTSMDLSSGMLNAASRLASSYGCQITPHQSTAENFNLDSSEKFDIIYAGNLMHHVDIDLTLKQISHHLNKDGVLVTWDPLIYNPIINVYRALARDVRTPDEHPLRISDIRLYERYFNEVKTKYFWLTTLSIFLIMYFIQRRDPNKERFWKIVVREGHKWEKLYKCLEIFDRFIMKLIPPVKFLCWNVVIVAKNK